MKTLFVMDFEDYGADFPIILRKTVRGVIERDGRLATQRGGNGEFKLPGGGIEEGETYLAALQREVREETGLIVLPDTVTDIGEVVEYREDIFSKGYKYEAHSYYYKCEISEKTVALSMTPSELAAGYHLAWASIDEIIETNHRLMDATWKLRDTRFLEIYRDIQK